MLPTSNQTIQELQSAITYAVNHIGADNADPQFPVITDLHICVDPDTGILTITTDDDDDNPIATANIDQWIDYDPDTDTPQIIKTLTTLLGRLDSQGIFDATPIERPFAFTLVDTTHETISELYLVTDTTSGDDDDDTVYIPGPLLSGMDEDLDNFLEHLMND